eukprot:scaffold80491_cov30-Phaeocystis_antarctica.AAC.1
MVRARAKGRVRVRVKREVHDRRRLVVGGGDVTWSGRRARLRLRGGRGVTVDRVVPVVGVDEGGADVHALVCEQLLRAARQEPRDLAAHACGVNRRPTRGRGNRRGRISGACSR